MVIGRGQCERMAVDRGFKVDLGYRRTTRFKAETMAAPYTTDVPTVLVLQFEAEFVFAEEAAWLLALASSDLKKGIRMISICL